jgi:hypothetical protein
MDDRSYFSNAELRTMSAAHTQRSATGSTLRSIVAAISYSCRSALANSSVAARRAGSHVAASTSKATMPALPLSDEVRLGAGQRGRILRLNLLELLLRVGERRAPLSAVVRRSGGRAYRVGAARESMLRSLAGCEPSVRDGTMCEV